LRNSSNEEPKWDFEDHTLDRYRSGTDPNLTLGASTDFYAANVGNRLSPIEMTRGFAALLASNRIIGGNADRSASPREERKGWKLITYAGIPNTNSTT